MYQRVIESHIRKALAEYPVVALTGPRQSGKTYLLRRRFSDYRYVLLDEIDKRQYAQSDPRGFLAQFTGPVIIDEAQRVPELFSYLLALVDSSEESGRFILSGSQNFLLLESITQSLSGRVAVTHLLPLSLDELAFRPPISISDLEAGRLPSDSGFQKDLFETLITGGYPRIHDRQLDPRQWLDDYFQTYVQRDVRTLLNVGSLDSFTRFVQLCAGRVGHPLNASALGSDCGVSHVTVKRWLSVLQASFVLFLLEPHFDNFSKRIVKAPKLFFFDTGLLCRLLRIRLADELRMSPYRGAVFESYVVSELYKAYVHQRQQPPLYYWRDSAGREVDLVIDAGSRLVPVEIKSGETMNPSMTSGLTYWRSLARERAGPSMLVYGGTESFTFRDCRVYSWKCL